MVQENFDAIVIGAGQAGPSLAARCGEAGLRVAFIERHLLGGTCVNTGCFPTKTLVASARAVHLARRGEEFGFETGPVRVDMRRVKARMDGVVAAARSGLEDWVRGMKGVEWITGHACFTAPRTVRVGERELKADRIFINVGARAARPPLNGIDNVSTLDNASVLQLQEVPRHLVIVGGSYIGLEFAQLMRRFGAEVSVVERSPRLLPREDTDVAAEVQAILEREGVRFHLGAECIAFAPGEAAVRVRAHCGPQDVWLEGSHVLLAMGRTPNTGDLGLEAAGIRADARGFIEVDDQCRTSAEGVWAVGECNGRGAFTHTAWDDHEIVAANVLRGETRSLRDRVPCYALFIDPPLGRAGMNEEQVRATGRPALVGKRAMRRVGRAKESGETQGFMKVLVDAQTRRILGASLLGLAGDEVVHVLLDAIVHGTTATALARTMHIHPTVAELIPTLLQELQPLEEGA
ncbi:MAG TPA: FAD-containing oxidoreductase [Ramlibacter sp.]|uniref:FAD-containing oxidoreductase n=1 Tax=Ramlibacter sp. TaxID=1917967 RepID=UPI002ED45555